MSKSFLVRQLLNVVSTANALRPVPGMPTSVPAFLAGWLTSELAPQQLAGITDPATGTPIDWASTARPFAFRRRGIERVRNLAYASGGTRYLLDVYRHRDTRAGAPILLQIHGGGWVIGNKDQQGQPLMAEMASRGWVCVSVNYPLSPKAVWPERR